MKTKGLLQIEELAQEEDNGDKKPAVKWVKHEKFDGIMLIHHKAVSTVEWHFKGDYFTTVVPSDILYKACNLVLFYCKCTLAE
jgi:ribosome biogenesis protein ERB1